MTKLRLLFISVQICCFLLSYSQKPDSIPKLTIKQLMNAIYQPSLDSEFDSNLMLKNGIHYYPNENGVIDSASYTEIDDRMVAFGDLNNDGIDDAVVILGTDGGGTGYFMDLVTVYNRNGKPKCIASKSLGDRVVVKNIKINNGVIELKMLTHAEKDGQCCPSRKTAPKFIVKGKKLVEITGVNFY